MQRDSSQHQSQPQSPARERPKRCNSNLRMRRYFERIVDVRYHIRGGGYVREMRDSGNTLEVLLRKQLL